MNVIRSAIFGERREEAALSIGFVGAGKMATAIVEEAIRLDQVKPDEMSCVSKSGRSAEELARKTGIRAYQTIEELVTNNRVVVFACSADDFSAMPRPSVKLTKEHYVLSVMEGMNLTELRERCSEWKNCVQVVNFSIHMTYLLTKAEVPFNIKEELLSEVMAANRDKVAKVSLDAKEVLRNSTPLCSVDDHENKEMLDIASRLLCEPK